MQQAIIVNDSVSGRSGVYFDGQLVLECLDLKPCDILNALNIETETIEVLMGGDFPERYGDLAYKLAAPYLKDYIFSDNELRKKLESLDDNGWREFAICLRSLLNED